MTYSTDNQTPTNKTLVQCDFDGTVTLEDASFIILDAFARGDWRRINEDYEAGKINVGCFNREAIKLVRASRKAMLELLEGKVNIRPGFTEFVEFCRRKNYRLVIVSNGFDIYIKHILKHLGLDKIEYHAAQLRFGGGRVTTCYIGPDGDLVEESIKEAFVDSFIKQGYRIIYIGDGASDFIPARKCQQIFARGTLLQRCEVAGVPNIPFSDFHYIIKKLNVLNKRK